MRTEVENDLAKALDTVSDENKFKQYMWVDGSANNASVNLSPSTATLTVGGSETLTATVLPANATDKTVKWSINNSNVKLYSDADCTAEVGADATDKLTVYAKGVSAGTATVTATSNADSNKSASCAVTVNAASAEHTIGVGTIWHVGDSINLGGKYYHFSDGNLSYVSKSRIWHSGET